VALGVGICNAEHDGISMREVMLCDTVQFR